MQILALTPRAYQPAYAIELPVVLDGQAMRVEFDKSAVRDLMQAAELSKDVVEEFLARYRTSIRVAIAAHLYAQGIPLDRHLVISRGDFIVRQPL